MSFLLVELTTTIVQTFCNTNKPINGVRSIYGHLTITTHFYRGVNRFPEGFQATYLVEKQIFPGESLLTQEEEGKKSVIFQNSSTSKFICQDKQTKLRIETVLFYFGNYVLFQKIQVLLIDKTYAMNRLCGIISSG